MLLRYLDAYFEDDLVFHRFVDLNELRFRIYEYYFETDDTSACLLWPHWPSPLPACYGHSFISRRLYNTALNSDTIAFLLLICLVDRAPIKAIEHLVTTSYVIIGHGQTGHDRSELSSLATKHLVTTSCVFVSHGRTNHDRSGLSSLQEVGSHFLYSRGAFRPACAPSPGEVYEQPPTCYLLLFSPHGV
jgi:hypothetical protein